MRMLEPHSRQLANRARVLALSVGAAAVSLLTPSGLRGQELLQTFDGDNVLWNLANDAYGCSVSDVGDVDGDGVPDALIGAFLEDQVYSVEIGSAYLVSGATGVVIREHFGPQDRSLFGLHLTGGADFDGDAIPDYLVAAQEYDGAAGFGIGAVYIYSGADGSLLHALEGEAQYDSFGTSVALLGDLDGDGTQDFGVGAPGFDASVWQTMTGRAYVYSGATGSLLYTVTGRVVNQLLGPMCRLGDLNGDGREEVGLGSYGPTAGPNGEGQFDVVDGPTGTLLYSLYGEAAGDHFGLYEAGLGDVDAVGVLDFLVCAPYHTVDPSSSVHNEGRVYVYSGATAALLYQFDGVQPNEQFGAYLQADGRIDFNRDGYADILIGSGSRSTTKKGKGALFVYSGRTGRLLHRFSRFLDEPISGSCGSSVSAVGDMNQDGIDDLIVGAPSTWIGKSASAGRAYVFAGNDLFLQANAYDQIAGRTATIWIRGGPPGVLSALVVTELNAAPTFVPALVAPLDQYGELTLSDTVPPGLSGVTMTFMAYAQKSSGRGLIDSIEEAIEFQ